MRSYPDHVEIREPVWIAPDVQLERCAIGPNVSIDERCVVSSSLVENTLIGSGCHVSQAAVRDSLIADDVRVHGAQLRGRIISRGSSARNAGS